MNQETNFYQPALCTSQIAYWNS